MSTKLDFPGGGCIIVNDPDEVPGMIRTIRNFNQKSDNFHLQLMEVGVKAYRCNDGWVNRKHNIVTFFDSERQRGWYWGNMNLNIGDRIFLGNASDGGQFAVIDGIAEKGMWSSRYHYKLIDDYMRFDKPSPISKWAKIKCFFPKLLRL